MSPLGNTPGFARAVNFPVKPVMLFDAEVALLDKTGTTVALPYWPTVVVSGITAAETVQIQVANNIKDPQWQDLGVPITVDGAYVLDTGAILARAKFAATGGGAAVTVTLGGNPPG